MKRYFLASGIFFLTLSPPAKAEDGAWAKAYPQEESFADDAKKWAPIGAEGVTGLAGAAMPVGLLNRAKDELQDAAMDLAEQRYSATHPIEAKLIERRRYVESHEEYYRTPPQGTTKEKIEFFNSPEHWAFETERHKLQRRAYELSKADAAIEKEAAQILGDIKAGRMAPPEMQLALKKRGVLKTLAGFKLSLSALLLADTARRINNAVTAKDPSYSAAIESSRSVGIKHPWVDLTPDDPHANDTSMNSHE